MKRILIIEPHTTGHRPSYVRWLVEYAQQLGHFIVLATQNDAIWHTQLKELFNSGSSKLEFIPMEVGVDMECSPQFSFWTLIRRELAYYRSFSSVFHRASQSARLDGVVIPYLDYCIHMIAAFGSPFAATPWCGITMRWRAEANGGRFSLVKTWAVRRILTNSTLRALFSINPSIEKVIATASRRTNSRLRYLADPAEIRRPQERAIARKRLRLSAETVVVLVFGTIDERKGLRPLLDALLTKTENARFQVLIAGKQSESIRTMLSYSPYSELIACNKIIIQDYILDDEAQGFVFAASDIVWVGYVGHLFMSGVLALAGFSQLPVIACAEGEIGELVRIQRLGLTVEVDDVEEVARALGVLEDSSTRAAYGRNAAVYFQAHEPHVFGRTIFSTLESSE